MVQYYLDLLVHPVQPVPLVALVPLETPVLLVLLVQEVW